MGFKGDLSTVGLADLFQMITMSQKEGTLLVQDKESRKCIFFARDGIRLLSTGKRKTFRIGEYLLKKGKITGKDLEKVLKIQKKTGQKIGEVLISENMVTEGDVHVIVRAQIEEEIYDLFHWKNANFEFIEGPPSQDIVETDHSITQLSLDVQSLLFEAARRLDEWERIKDRIAGVDVPYLLLKNIGGELQQAWPGLQAILQNRVSVRKLSEELQIPLYEAARIFVSLVDDQAIRPVTPQEALEMGRESFSRGDADGGLSLILAIRPLLGDQPELLHGAAEILAGAGVSAEAAEFFRRAAEVYEVTEQPESARNEYASGIEAAPEQVEIRRAYVVFLSKVGDMKTVREQIGVLAAQMSSRGMLDEAVRVGDELLERAPEDVYLHMTLAELTVKQGNTERAQAEIKVVQKHLPDDLVLKEQFLKRIAALGLVEVSPRSRSAEPSHRKSYLKYAMIVLGLAVAGCAFYRIYFELTARSRFHEARAKSSSLEHDGKVAEALQEIAAFRKSAYGGSWWIGGEADREQQRLKELLDAKKIVQPVPDHPGGTTLPSKALIDLEQRMQQAFSRGYLSLTLQLAQQLKEEATKERNNTYLSKAQDMVQAVDQYHKKAAAMLAQSRDLESKGRVSDAVTALKKLMQQYPYSESAKTAAFPLRISSRPPGARVFQNNIDMGTTPVIIHLPQQGEADVRLQKEGYTTHSSRVSMNDSGEVMLTLLKSYLWRQGIGSPLETSPVLNDGLLYFLSRGRVYACSLANRGKVLWDFGVSSDIESAPALIQSRLFFGTRDGTLYVLDLTKPQPAVLWKASVSDPIRTRTVYLPDKDAFLFGSTDGFIHAVDSKGSPLWKIKLTSKIVDLMIVDRKMAVAACTDGSVVAFTGPSSRETVWKKEIGKSISRGPVSYRNLVIVGCTDGTLAGMRAASGDVLWTAPLGESITALSGGEGETVYIGAKNGTLTAVHAADGKPLWTLDTGQPIYSDPGVFGTRILFGNDSGEMYCVDSGSGSVQWVFKADGSVHGSPVVVGKTVYFGSSDKNLYAVDLD